MLIKSIIIIVSLFSTLTVNAKNNMSLAEVKKILTKQQYMQYTHDLWEEDRIKAVVTDYSAQFNNKQGGNTLTVGPNVLCGFPTIQLAINFAIPGDTIFVADDLIIGTDAKLNIDKSLTLVGGLDSTCQVFTTNRTHLQLDDTGPVITIDVGHDRVVNISGFDISGSQTHNILAHTSGVYVFGDDTFNATGTVTISNSHIHDNNSLLGGGISAVKKSTININQNTEIYANTALAQGGGVYCHKSNLNVIHTLIGKVGNGSERGNFITSDVGEGGGLYSGNCNVNLGETSIGNGAVEISYNVGENGAGIFTVDSNIDFGVDGSRISFNSSPDAFGVGNAINANNVNNINLDNIKITDNWFGSTIRIAGTTDLNIKSTCQQPPCSEISRNKDEVLVALQNSSAIISNTIISNNNNPVITSNSLNVVGITLINSIISDNSTNQFNTPIIHQTQGPIMKFDNITIANNSGYSTIFGSALDTGGDNNFKGGIIWGNDVTDLTDDNFNGTVDISHSIIQFNPLGYHNTLQADPLFKNTNTGDYHITFASPAVDHFDSSLISDFEGDSRPHGLLDDAGADEWTDLIFANGFEEN